MWHHRDDAFYQQLTAGLYESSEDNQPEAEPQTVQSPPRQEPFNQIEDKPLSGWTRIVALAERLHPFDLLLLVALAGLSFVARTVPGSEHIGESAKFGMLALLVGAMIGLIVFRWLAGPPRH